MLPVCRVRILMKEISFCRKVQYFLRFIEVGSEEREVGTYLRYSIENILNLSQSLRNCLYIWGYASTAIRHNATQLFLLDIIGFQTYSTGLVNLKSGLSLHINFATTAIKPILNYLIFTSKLLRFCLQIFLPGRKI